MTDDLTSLGRSIGQISNSLRSLGVDMGALQATSAAFQMVGGSAQILKGLIATYNAYNAFKAAEGTAHLAKYGLGALGVAALATAGGVAMGVMIERAINTTDDGQGMRALAGGYADGRY
jgi:hypothetical protein